MDKRLPFELIADIFAYCVHEHRVPPERLSRINRTLRHVAINTAELWSFVYYGGAARDQARTVVCLNRSASAPLTVELDLTPGFAVDDEAVASLVSILAPHSGRIKSFRLAKYDGWKTIEPLFSHFTESDRLNGLGLLLDRLYDAHSSGTLRLEEFVLTPGSLTSDMPIPDFVNSASLRRLVVIDVTLPSIARALDSSAQSLVVVHLKFRFVDSPSFSRLMNSLRSLVQLQELKLELPKSLREAATPLSPHDRIEPIVLKTLRSLTMQGYPSPMLPLVQCPSLLDTTLEFYNDETENLDDTLLFLTRHAETISSLHLPCLPKQGAKPSDVPPLSYPALKYISGTFIGYHASSILTTIQGVSLTEIDISVYQWITLESLTAFFGAASQTVRKVTVSYGFVHPSPMLSPHAMDTGARIHFSSLDTFISRCYQGDAIISMIATAPLLKTLQLHGPLNLPDVPALTNIDVYVCNHPSKYVARSKEN